jgi:hypothetical protein
MYLYGISTLIAPAGNESEQVNQYQQRGHNNNNYPYPEIRRG